MSVLDFILGVSVGVGYCFWRKYQLQQELKKLFNLLSNELNHAPSLPLLSLVRREVLTVKTRILDLEEDLKIYENLIENAPFGYLLIDPENQLIWLNKEAKNLLNIEEDRWQEGKFPLFLEVVRSYELDQLIEKTRQFNIVKTLEWQFFSHKNPTNNSYPKNSIFLKASAIPLNNKNIAIFLENKQSSTELQKDRERSFSDLTHELKTPLTAIRLVAETLEKRLQKPEVTWVQQMLKETNRLIDLIQNWLEITQLQENPTQYLQFQSLDLKDLIFSVWNSLQPLAIKKHLDFNYRGPETIYLQADQTRLTQVFVNILDNAIKHSPMEGIINVEIQQNVTMKTVQINIIDSGNGFIEADIPLIFKRLYKGDPSRTRQSLNPENQGHGLGLAIVEEIINAHQGKIVAKNDPQTGGGRLEIILPFK